MTTKLMEEILNKENLETAMKAVIANKGSAGVARVADQGQNTRQRTGSGVACRGDWHFDTNKDRTRYQCAEVRTAACQTSADSESGWQ